VSISGSGSSHRDDGTTTTPPIYVARLHDTRLVGRGVAVLTHDGRTLSDVTVHLNGRIEDHGIMRRVWLPRLEYVPGTTAVLSAPGGNTYYHWLFDLLPRLYLIQRAGYNLRDVDHIIVNSTRFAYQRETLATLSVDMNCVMSSDAHRHIQCETMLLPSFPGKSGDPPKWVCDFLHRALLPDDACELNSHPSTPRRLYITRQSAATRRLHNHDAVLHRLANLGFTAVTLETLTVAEQARLLHGADVIFGVHGSGFTNLVFCRPGTRLLELHSPNEQPDCYEALSRRVGIRYVTLIGRRSPDPYRISDVVVDPDLLERTLLPLLSCV
jgi:capsular polysaccharide biosynthesis protein